MKVRRLKLNPRTRRLGGLAGLLVLLGSFGLDPLRALAAERGLEITEIMYDLPGSDSDREWLEVTNFGSLPIQITPGSGTGSWRMSDSANHVLTLSQGSVQIDPQASAILAQNGDRFLSDHPTYTGTIFRTAISLSNTSATLKLSSDKGLTWFHERAYASSMGAAGDGHTLEWNGQTWLVSTVSGGTPGSGGVVVPTPVPTSNPSPPNELPPLPPPPNPTMSPEPILSLPPPVPIEPRLVATEIAYDLPGSDVGKEWIEFQNQGTGPLIFPAEGSRPWRLRIGTTVHLLGLPAQALAAVGVGDYFVVVRDRTRFLEEHPDRVTTPLLTASFSLNNNMSEIALSLDKGQTWGTSTTYQRQSGARGDGRTIELLADGSWQPSPLNGGTPGAVPGARSPDPPALVRINEFLPAAATHEPSWIELMTTGKTAVDLAGWQLDDGPRGSRPYQIQSARLGGSIITPGNFLVFSQEETHLNLHERDSVRLLDPANQVIEEIPYERPMAGASWIQLVGGPGAWTRLPTAGSVNSLVPAFSDTTLTEPFAPVVRAASIPVVVDQEKPTSYQGSLLPPETGWHVEIHGVIERRQRLSLKIRTDAGEPVILRLAASPPAEAHAHRQIIARGQLAWVDNEPEVTIFQTTDLEILPEPAKLQRTKALTRLAPPTRAPQAIVRPTIIGHSHNQPRAQTLSAPPQSSTAPLPWFMMGSIFGVVFLIRPKPALVRN